MIQDIEKSLVKIEEHIENINALLPGLPEDVAEDLLDYILAAENNMEVAFSHFEAR
jgi:hypothetical protein